MQLNLAALGAFLRTGQTDEGVSTACAGRIGREWFKANGGDEPHSGAFRTADKLVNGLSTPGHPERVNAGWAIARREPRVSNALRTCGVMNRQLQSGQIRHEYHADEQHDREAIQRLRGQAPCSQQAHQGPGDQQRTDQRPRRTCALHASKQHPAHFSGLEITHRLNHTRLVKNSAPAPKDHGLCRRQCQRLPCEREPSADSCSGGHGAPRPGPFSTTGDQMPPHSEQRHKPRCVPVSSVLSG